jgi:iron complex transport system ATP-binding protein
VYLFDSSALQIALTGRHPHLKRWDRESHDDVEMATNALSAVGLDGFADREVTSRYGGEARRLAFASLLVQNPGILLLDEPTNHLDLRMDIASGLVTRQGNVAFSALHDVNLAARYCSHILMLFGEGEWKAGSCSEMLESELLERLYGCRVETIQTANGPRFHPLDVVSEGSS